MLEAPAPAKKMNKKKVQNNKRKIKAITMTIQKFQSILIEMESTNGCAPTSLSPSKAHRSPQLDSFKATKNKSPTDSEKETDQVNI